jgi:hypothetical protein
MSTSWRRSMSLASAMRHPRRYSIGGMPTLRRKQSKKAVRESAASFASSTIVHDRAGSAWMPWRWQGVGRHHSTGFV